MQDRTISAAEADHLLGHALDNGSRAIALAERYEAALREIAAGSYPVPLNEDADAWRRLAAMRKDIAKRALDHG